MVSIIINMYCNVHEQEVAYHLGYYALVMRRCCCHIQLDEDQLVVQSHAAACRCNRVSQTIQLHITALEDDGHEATQSLPFCNGVNKTASMC